MKNDPEIAIIGGGPAGLTAAIILQRGGFRVRVFEADASPDARTQGGTLDLHADSGQIALQRAGLLAEFRSIARHEDQETRTVDWQTGSLLPAVPQPNSDQDRPEIDRGVLRNLLLRALPVQYLEWNRSLIDVQRKAAGRFTLNFRGGRSSEADIVIGADGAWSAVRRYLSPVDPLYTGITFMEGWIDSPTIDEAGLVGRGTLFCFGASQALIAQRNGKGRICVYAALKQPKDALNEQIRALGANMMVQEAYQGWALPLRGLLSACVDFVPRSIYHMPADFQWVAKESITLIGDAAHLMPPVGVGVNLAMLDASDLAMAMATGSNLQQSIQQAESEIRERAGLLMPDAISSFAQWFS